MEIAIGLLSLTLGLLLLIGSIIIWILAPRRKWLESVPFVSHLSLAALVFSALSTVISALAALFAGGSGKP